MDLVHRHRPVDAVRLGRLIRVPVFAVLASLAAMLCACDGTDAPKPRQTGGDKTPQRIVTLAPHLAELVYALGAGDRLVGTVARSDYPQAALDLPRIGDAFRVDQERLAELSPDLVLVWPGGNPQELIDDLHARGLPVAEVEIVRLGDVADALRELGNTLGESARGEALAAEFERGIEALRSAAEGATPLRVFHQISAQPLFTIGGEHSISDVLAVCGGVNIFADLDRLAATVSHEAVVARVPDVILSTEPPNSDAFETWQRFSSLPAVSTAQLHYVDPDLVSRPGPRLLDGARQICALLAAAR